MYDLPESVLAMLLQLGTSFLLSYGSACSFKRCVSSPFSVPSSRKDCLPRAMLSSPF